MSLHVDDALLIRLPSSMCICICMYVRACSLASSDWSTAGISMATPDPSHVSFWGRYESAGTKPCLSHTFPLSLPSSPLSLHSMFTTQSSSWTLLVSLTFSVTSLSPATPGSVMRQQLAWHVSTIHLLMALRHCFWLLSLLRWSLTISSSKMFVCSTD